MLDTVADAAEARVTAARRDLADRIDPAPVPRRGLRLLSLGLLVTTVSAVVWAVLERRSPQTTPQPTTLRGGPEHLPSTAPTDGADTDGEAAPTASDDEPVAGLTGDPEARGRRPAEPARTTRSGVPGRGESCNLDVLRFVGPADPAGAPARPEGTA